jgi:hypothetical protein
MNVSSLPATVGSSVPLPGFSFGGRSYERRLIRGKGGYVILGFRVPGGLEKVLLAKPDDNHGVAEWDSPRGDLTALERAAALM